MADRQRICAECSRQFSYQVARGTDRIFCGPACANAASARQQEQARLNWPECSVVECGVTVRSAGSEFCEKHYMRKRRRGSLLRMVEDSPPPVEAMHSHGYVKEYLPLHPLWCETQGRIYQHRRVFFDAHGKGPHPCYWCSKSLEWPEMDVDHLNAVRDDNSLSNLVASCPACNRDRARPKLAHVTRQRAVHRYTHEGLTLTAQQWATKVGISRASLMARIKAGWPLGRALTEGRGQAGPRRAS